MTPVDPLLAGVIGLAGGWLTYLLAGLWSQPRYRFEKHLTILAPAVLFPIFAQKAGFGSGVMIANAGLGLALVGVTLFDFRKHQIPHVVTIPGVVAGLTLGSLVLPIGFARSLIGLLFGGGVLIVATFVEAARRKEVGGGDWKLAAMIGAFLGWPGVVTALVATGVLGIVGAVILRKRGSVGPQALGPWLSAGALVSLIIS